MSALESHVALAVSTVIFALRPSATGEPELVIPLVRRIRAPYEGQWALPGGPLNTDEDLSQAASRTLLETTALEPRYLEQLYAFGQLDRSPDDRVVSIVYWALVAGDEADRAIQSENVQWFAADDLPELAFDHNLIVDYALWRLRTKLEYSRIAHGFLGETFTLAQLREVYEIVLRRPLDPGNFRRMVEASGTVVPTGERLAGTRHRPPQLYRYDTSIDLTDQGPLSRLSAPRTLASTRGENR
ncbi:8-oxo-dGTP diphosphatase [Aurantimicrobium minutum]|uniref:NUDIX hydrolase n=1 Tax=Aurantimicrobium minutum TaxID=708131 RepID=UPI0024747672|nr:NUDIX domain-containing protein [Aurantimicrobium minutum]MDH6533294.1 8-oxo-dGTP diphosphatase [Aurantimicrobium minutum]